MEKCRIAVELFLSKLNFSEVSALGKQLEKEGIKAILMPPEDRGMNVHLVIEKSDLQKVKIKLTKEKISFMEKEVIIVGLDNKPGELSDITAKISSKGINLLYAFAVSMSPDFSYVLLGTSDNPAALKVLS